MKDNILRDKSYAFALRIVKLYQYLSKEKHELVLSKQVLRSGTSIGAQSDKDFKAKLAIAYKEARETHYWLRLLKDASILNPLQAGSVIDDCEGLLKIIGKIQSTLRKNRNS
jgi:four helix bundle protein